MGHDSIFLWQAGENLVYCTLITQLTELVSSTTAAPVPCQCTHWILSAVILLFTQKCSHSSHRSMSNQCNYQHKKEGNTLEKILQVAVCM